MILSALDTFLTSQITTEIISTTTTTKTKNNFLISKYSTIISITVVTFGLTISITWIICRLNCVRSSYRDRQYSLEEIPKSSPVESSSQPFMQNDYEFSENTDS